MCIFLQIDYLKINHKIIKKYNNLKMFTLVDILNYTMFNID